MGITVKRLVLLLVFCCSCGSVGDPLRQTHSKAGDLAITRVSGHAQKGRPGQTLAAPFVVLVTNAKGRLVAEQRVDFSIRRGGGRLSVESALTDGTGMAATRLTLGERPDEAQVLAVIFGYGSVVEFNAAIVDGTQRP